MNRLQATRALGQHLWLDNLSRTLLRDGSLLQLIRNEGISGITSNPSIFQKAIASSPYYRDDLQALRGTDLSVEQRYEQLAVADIREACDYLLHERHHGGPLAGWVSLEVSPALADDATGTIEAARRLVAAVDCPNLLIKVPATAAGLVAMRQLIREGISINATLVFSPRQITGVREAYIAGLRDRLADGATLDDVFSVSSVFLSRIDTLLDKLLQALNSPAALALQGKVAIANSRTAWAEQQQRWQTADWQALREHGAHPQYLLWASTGTKNPAYPDTLYLDSLIAADTINTVPDATLAAFRDHGQVAAFTEVDVAAARDILRQVRELGLDLDALGEALQQDGITLFRDSFNQMLQQLA